MQSFEEGTLVSRLIPEEECETLFIQSFRGEAVILETKGALLDPMRLGHLADQELFDRVHGLEIHAKAGEQGVEGGGVLTRNQELAGSEAVSERVTRGGQFA